MKLVHDVFRRSGKPLILSTVCGLISGLAGAALIVVISKGLQGGAQWPSLSWVFFGICLIWLISKCCAELSLLHATQTAVLFLRTDLSRKLLATPLRRLQDLQKHRLFVIVTRDIDTVVGALQSAPPALTNSIVIVACLGYMASVSLQLFAAFTTLFIVCGYAYRRAERRPRARLIAAREQLDVIYGHFRGLIEGSKELQLNAQHGTSFVEEVIAPTARDLRQSYIRAMTGYSLVSNSGIILFYLVIGFLLFVVPFWLPQRTDVLITVTLIVLYLVRPINETMLAIPTLQQSIIALRKIQQLDDTLEQAAERSITADPFGAAGAATLIELRGVRHSYRNGEGDNHFALGPIDLALERGELVFITGGNGSGKTTLAMLLLGLYQPEAGTVLLNGICVTPSNIHHYRQRFAAVFSDFHLFEQLLGTERQQLDERATYYIRQFGLAHKVRVVDGQFSTIDLSQGQRKRLALVSSYLEDRPIYLFDEWAADQDPAFKRVFYNELLPDLKKRGKTILAISHDDAYFCCADRVIKLVEGHLEVTLIN
jgi:putative ATP-binding cassette transporter